MNALALLLPLLAAPDGDRLTVITRPEGAKLFIDGTFQGLTPVTVTGLEPDVTYNLTLKLYGYEKQTERFTFTGNETLDIPLVEEHYGESGCTGVNDRTLCALGGCCAGGGFLYLMLMLFLSTMTMTTS